MGVSYCRPQSKLQFGNCLSNRSKLSGAAMSGGESMMNTLLELKKYILENSSLPLLDEYFERIESCGRRLPEPEDRTEVIYTAFVIKLLLIIKDAICKVTQEQVDGGLSCHVCLEDFRLNEIIYKIACNHSFHKKCLETWMEYNFTCPVCRHYISAKKKNN